jgi:uncharacterized protein (TIGR03437 family)
MQAQPQIGGGACSAASLTGDYVFSISGRQLAQSGAFQAVFQSLGTASFDGQGNVMISQSTNSNNGAARQQYSGTYTVPSNCGGTLTATIFAGHIGSFTMTVFNQGRAFALSGTDGTYTISGGGSLLPSSCLISTLSGGYSLNGTGWALSGNTVSAVLDITGGLQFDGNGNVSVTGNITAANEVFAISASGTYSMTKNCVYSATLQSNGTNTSLSIVVTNPNGGDFDVIGATPLFITSGAAHSLFEPPALAIGNSASGRPNFAPAGSLFTIVGQDLASGNKVAKTVPLPDTLLSTTVTVNGKPAPLYFVSPGQINAQLPAQTTPGLATVLVKNGNTLSNATAIMVPETGPGIFVTGNNRGVVQNPNHKQNTEANPAKVDDVLVAYFTGGGPVTTKGLLTGMPAPLELSPVTGGHTVTVSGKAAKTTYVGLAPGLIGIYQADFKVPPVAAGDHPLQIVVGGRASNTPVITVSN